MFLTWRRRRLPSSGYRSTVCCHAEARLPPGHASRSSGIRRSTSRPAPSSSTTSNGSGPRSPGRSRRSPMTSTPRSSRHGCEGPSRLAGRMRRLLSVTLRSRLSPALFAAPLDPANARRRDHDEVLRGADRADDGERTRLDVRTRRPDPPGCAEELGATRHDVVDERDLRRQREWRGELQALEVGARLRPVFRSRRRRLRHGDDPLQARESALAEPLGSKALDDLEHGPEVPRRSRPLRGIGTNAVSASRNSSRTTPLARGVAARPTRRPSHRGPTRFSFRRLMKFCARLISFVSRRGQYARNEAKGSSERDGFTDVVRGQDVEQIGHRVERRTRRGRPCRAARRDLRRRAT